MKTPRDKYMNDNAYSAYVDCMVGMIIQCHFTPSELREMALLASILYEEKQIQQVHCLNEKKKQLKVVQALKTAWEWACPVNNELKTPKSL